MLRDRHAAVTRDSRVSHGTLSSPVPSRPVPSCKNPRANDQIQPHLSNARVAEIPAAGAKIAPLPSMTRTRLPSCTGTNSSLQLNYRPRAGALCDASPKRRGGAQ